MYALILAAALAQAPAAGDLDKGDVAPAAQADGGAPKKDGPDPDKLPFTNFSIQEIVKYHLPQVQKCYNDVVAELGGKLPEGRVFATFTILPNGLTTQVKIDKKKTTLKNPRIHDCVADEIRGWQFPKPTDGREHPIEYPFDLKIQKDK